VAAAAARGREVPPPDPLGAPIVGVGLAKRAPSTATSMRCTCACGRTSARSVARVRFGVLYLLGEGAGGRRRPVVGVAWCACSVRRARARVLDPLCGCAGVELTCLSMRFGGACCVSFVP